MKAMQLSKQAPLETKPLQMCELPVPEPAENQVRIKINVCGACRTDLHIVEGELPAHKIPLIIGHQIIGRIDKLGKAVNRWQLNDRVGVPWLYRTCGQCPYCLQSRENLCDRPMFTGYDADGGFAEYMVVDENFTYSIPVIYHDTEAAPLLCAGVIGYQAFKATNLKSPGRLGLFGFGSSAHILLQVAQHLGHECFVVSRTDRELELAKNLGAVWTGSIDDNCGTELDAVIVFAPSGEVMVKALSKIHKGGIVVSAGIYATSLPGFEYSGIYPEKILTSIAHTTRANVREFMKIAGDFKIETHINEYPLEQVNQALLNIKNSSVSGSTVIKMSITTY
ncbi:hypothetical protein A2Y85_01405 [candidate division WOR-3 bacterium RBG_13_43_14]|uniref:Alcohol dehydrogenase-like N-terminal domain-containing protein n=1 Tax=candidate division WOR-3 bacterium RBG_13_43_14 TaxID=1802590 RepID=A0A1F4U6N5_UNCW3|nr:MAG: hypothetical protein A2Y85_01405 [candidate division WOR-3 bacterium RBG_13_43_14]